MQATGGAAEVSDADPGPWREEDWRANDHAVADGRLDWIFDLLASRRRRIVIAELRTSADGVASLEELAEHLLAADPDADDRVRTVVALQHRTLPRLHDAGVVDFDRRTDTVRYRGNEQVEALLAFAADWTE
jgi:hypothetical protein